MAEVIGQLPLPGISVRAIRCDPLGINTATCATVCRCDDGSDYAIKRQNPSPSTPHNEWFCTRVGELVGLASPPCRIVDVNSEMCFGSRWETGNQHADWWVAAKIGGIDFNLLAPTISRIFAFDLFVHNTDRHMKNYIVRAQALGHSILSYDYSSSRLFHGWPMPDLPLKAKSNTIRNMRYMRKEFGEFIERSEIDTILSRIDAIDGGKIEAIISEHPPDWLSDAEKAQILGWWNSSEKQARLRKIEKGISDGSCL